MIFSFPFFIEFAEPRKIRASFKKLMRACVPSAASSQPDQSFLKMVEGSDWFTLLQSLMQLSGAVVDLLDIQVIEAFCCQKSILQLLFLIDQTASLNLCPIYVKFALALAKLSEHMHKKFQVNQTNIKGGCQSERKSAEMISYSKMPLANFFNIS